MELTICTNCGKKNPNNSKYCSGCGFELPKVEIEIADNTIQPQPSELKNKKKKRLGMIVGAIAFALSYYGVQQLFFKPPVFDKIMMQAASEINKTCPIMIDKDTRLDNAVAMPDNIFQYNYTLVSLDRAEVNMDTVKKYIEPRIINSVKTNPDLKIYRDNKTTMTYNYSDKNGGFIFKFAVTPDMYE